MNLTISSISLLFNSCVFVVFVKPWFDRKIANFIRKRQDQKEMKAIKREVKLEQKAQQAAQKLQAHQSKVQVNDFPWIITTFSWIFVPLERGGMFAKISVLFLFVHKICFRFRLTVLEIFFYVFFSKFDNKMSEKCQKL